jgi:hypothetical protein
VPKNVNYLFLEVLPPLNPGVIVHVHDILFPFDYRRDWVMDEFRFWTEHYLLQAVIALASENIIITGLQPDVRPYFDSVRLSIAPALRRRRQRKD